MLVVAEHRQHMPYMPRPQVLEIQRRYAPPRHVEPAPDAEYLRLQRLQRAGRQVVLPKPPRRTEHVEMRRVAPDAAQTAVDIARLQQRPIEALAVEGDHSREARE